MFSHRVHTLCFLWPLWRHGGPKEAETAGTIENMCSIGRGMREMCLGLCVWVLRWTLCQNTWVSILPCCTIRKSCSLYSGACSLLPTTWCTMIHRRSFRLWRTALASPLMFIHYNMLWGISDVNHVLWAVKRRVSSVSSSSNRTLRF